MTRSRGCFPTARPSSFRPTACLCRAISRRRLKSKRAAAMFMPRRAESGGGKSLLAMLFGGGGEDEAEESSARGGAMIASGAATSGGGRLGGGGGAQTFFTSQQVQVASGTPDTISKAKRDLPHGETYMTAPDAAPKPEVVASLDRANADQAAMTDPQSPIAPAARLAAPLPPHRPTEFLSAEIGLADRADAARPSRGIRLVASAQCAGDALAGAARFRRRAQERPDRGVAGAQTARRDHARRRRRYSSRRARPRRSRRMRPSRPAPLCQGGRAFRRLAARRSRAAFAAGARRAALGSAAAGSPRAQTAHDKAVLVAAKIDRSNFSVMTAAPANTPSAASGAARIVPPRRARLPSS